MSILCNIYFDRKIGLVLYVNRYIKPNDISDVAKRKKKPEPMNYADNKSSRECVINKSKVDLNILKDN